MLVWSGNNRIELVDSFIKVVIPNRSDADNYPDFLVCRDWVDNNYRLCVVMCPPHDAQCISECTRLYDDDINNCPCQDGCQNGCPCPLYECDQIATTSSEAGSTTTVAEVSTTSIGTTLSTTSANTVTPVLILNTEERTNSPLLTDINGGETKLSDFSMGDDTSVHGSCSLTWQNDMYIIGGRESYSRQISRIQRCRLARVGSLDFPLELGGCTGTALDNIGFLKFTRFSEPYKVARGLITLCFSEGNSKRCFYTPQSPLGQFYEVEESAYDHKLTRIASSNTEILAMGSRRPDHAHVEFLNMSSFEWSIGPSYPYASAINYAPILFHEGGFIVFGGFTANEPITTVARLGAVGKQWVKLGDLTRPRSDHGSIFVDGHFLVVGGESRGGVGAIQTEKCTLSELNQITCVSQSPSLFHYRQYPELFLVDNGFCSN